MKKLIAAALCLLLALLCPLAAQAAQHGAYENAGELYEAWMEAGGVPDYISGVWSTDGSCENLTFGIVEGEAGEEEILSLVRDDSTITIVYQTHSRNDLYRIQEAVEAWFEMDLGLVSVGVNEYENRLEIGIHASFRENADTLALMESLTETYGDAVFFHYMDTYPVLTLGTETTPTAPLVLARVQKQSWEIPMQLLLILFLCAAACMLAMQRQKRRLAALRADGIAVAGEQPGLAWKELEDTLRQSIPVCPDELEARIAATLQSLDKES